MTELASLIIQILQLIWSWVYFFCPIKATIIQKGSRGVRLSFGVWPRDIKPGLRVATIFQTLHSDEARYRTNVINSIRFVLRDGTPTKLDATIVYNIDSFGHFLLNSADSGFMVSEFANAEIKRTVSNYGAGDLAGQHDELEAEITEAIQSKCDEARLGVTIKYSRLTDVEILNNALQTAMCLPVVMSKLGDIINYDADAVPDHPAFPSLVALVTGNIMNTVGTEPADETVAEEDEEPEE